MTYEPEHYIVELTMANWYMIEGKNCVIETDYEVWAESRRLTLTNIMKALRLTRESLDKITEGSMERFEGMESNPKERHYWRWEIPSLGYRIGKRTCDKCGKVLSITNHAKVGPCYGKV